jgi:SAM-dependent methyltransferase
VPDQSLSLDLARIAALTARPPLFAPHDAPFWDDPYIATRMLAAHLDPNTDAASRRPETIDRTVTWLSTHLGLRSGARVLDLGCGPGLYCQRFAERGFDVTGVDLSANSLAYARDRAAQTGLSIRYLQQDYTRLDVDGRFDLVTLIYYDLCVLPDAARDAVLVHAATALKPGGAFVCDVLTPAHRPPPDGTGAWDVRPTGGFWRPGPYLELTRHFDYPEESVQLRQAVIVEPDGRVVAYRVWNRSYTPESIGEALARAGLRVESVWTELAGEPYTPETSGMGVVARKR